MGLIVYVVIISIISLILFPVADMLKKGAAASDATNNTVDNPDNSGKNNPIYQASGWSVGITKLKSAGFPQQVEVIFENGTINGIGRVTNLEAWIFSPIGSHGLGHGVITAKDNQMITWTAHDTSGTTNNNTKTSTYQGVITFNKTTGNLAFLNNLQGSYITVANGNNQTTRIWALK
jgi:hypothetical protein